MSIDEQPMNVYWSGKRTETSNTFKITDKGSVAEYSNLPNSGNQKGDKYEVTSDGSDYVWDGSAWSRLGAEKYAYEDIIGMPSFALDANVVHTTGDETITGTKIFSDQITGTAQYATDVAIGENDLASGRGLFTSVLLSSATDANTLTKQGIYFFKGNNSHAHLPGTAINGFLVVLVSSTSIIKQIFFRQGTPGQNDYDTSVRISTSGGDTWGDWCNFTVGARANSLIPNSDNASTLGNGDKRWKALYAATGSINTSDERRKAGIDAVPDGLLDAWEDVQWKIFQFRDAVEEKGAELARLHAGIVAQQVREAFEANGQQADKYGFFCWDSWGEGDEAGDAYAIRYDEALALEAAYQRRRAERAETRIKALEDRLEALEAKLA